MVLTNYREFMLRERVFSWTDNVEIFDPNTQQPIGFFHSRPFQMRKRFWLRELNDFPLVGVVQRFQFTTTFDFFEGGPSEDLDQNQPLGRLKRKALSWRPTYFFTGNNPRWNFMIRGNIWGMDFEIIEQQTNQIIAQISKKWWTWRDTYGLRIFQEIPDLFAMIILTSTIVLHHEKEQQENND